METTTNNLTTEKRDAINQILTGQSQSLLLVQGPCAPDIQGIGQLMDEAHDLHRVSRSFIAGVVAVNRLPVWKPRSNPASWHGLDTSHPIAADELIGSIDEQFGMAAIEIGLPEHIGKYASRLAFGWTGARNIENQGLMQQLAIAEPTLPIGIKNGLDGNIDQALKAIEKLRTERDSDGGAVTLIFRGGETLRTPETWEQAYLDALEATNGNMIVDLAHGGEMAHSPVQDFTKSVIGQIACFDHVIELAANGHIPVGTMAEASNTISKVDPVMPFETTILKTIELRNTVFAHRLD